LTSLLQIEHLTKSFGDKVLFEDISFGISEGQHIAIIARNGMGKTTLLNIITSIEMPDSGVISMRKDLRIGYLSQHPTFPPELTVLDACLKCDNAAVETIRLYEKALLMENDEQLALATAEMDAHRAWDYEARIKRILGKLRITRFEQPISQLSGGQLKRVALANVLIAEPELLILDEPTNHLDLDMVEWLEEFLQKSNIALLMVTHDRYFLDRVCTDILELDQRQLFAYHGNYEYYLEKRAERIDVFNAETDKFRNIYRTELDWMRRMPQARGHKARSRIDAFYDIEARAKQRIDDKTIHLDIKSPYIGSKIFEMKYISKSFTHHSQSSADRIVILNDFYYNFARYEKMGIVGANGTGKSTFLKILLGEESLDSGSIDIGETVRFGYYRQEGLQFDEQMKVIDAVRKYAEYIDLGGGKHLSASQFLQHFLFPPSQQNNYIYKLSGGERQRLHLCTILIQNPNFLILDEPTNDLDIVTLNILEQYLQDFKGCVIVVSHDRYFMDKIVDHLLVFKGNGVVKDFPGNYTQYRESYIQDVPQSQKSPKTSNIQNTQITPNTPTCRPRKLSFNEKRELEQLEHDMPILEQEKSDLEQQLSGGILSPEQILTISQRYEQLKTELDEKEIRWLELSESM